MAAPWLPCSVTLLALVLGVFPIHCIGNPTSEHQMAAMAHASGALPPAVLGSEAAVRYAAIAPAAPHALHMPSHIFMRLGLLQDDIRSSRETLEKLAIF
jgi:hypothetical protein